MSPLLHLPPVFLFSRQVMRQAITARRLANSPPAPSPSKKPKRASPQLAPKELAKLAKKQLGTIRKLLDGSGRPHPGPCGVERPVGDILKFVKKAHGAWMASVSFLIACGKTVTLLCTKFRLSEVRCR